MKKKTWLLAVCLIINIGVYAQNQLPIVKNLSLKQDAPNQRLEIRYDLEDPDNNFLHINVLIAGDHKIQATDYILEGDLGDSVQAGTDKIIIWDYAGALSAAGEVTISLIADDYESPDLEALTSQVNLDNLKNDLELVEGYRFPITKKDAKHHQEVRAHVKSAFTKYGLHLATQDTVMKSFKVQNIIGTREGTATEPETYILCAHYDAYYGSPGADDNASGVAGMLEAMRILSQYNFRHTIRFIGFDMEEDDLLGSTAYAQGNHGDNSRIGGVLNFDMIGCFYDKPNTQNVPEGFDVLFPEQHKAVMENEFKGDFVVINYIESSDEIREAFTQSAAQVVPGLKVIALDAAPEGEIIEDLTASDHLSFWKADVRAIHIGDGGASRNPHINTKKDKLKLINYSKMSEVVKATIATIANLAELTHSTVSTATVNIITE